MKKWENEESISYSKFLNKSCLEHRILKKRSINTMFLYIAGRFIASITHLISLQKQSSNKNPMGENLENIFYCFHSEFTG